MRRWVVILMAMLWVGLSASAQDSIARIRPVMSAYTLSIGGSQVADTYLTPLKYSGTALSLDYERWQAMRFDPEAWVMRLAVDVEVSKNDSPARNASIYGGMLDAQWGMMHRWRLPHSVILGVGPATSARIGVLYNQRNGNNPVAVKAAWMVEGAGYASWRFKAWRLPIVLTYHTSVPLTGVFFSPQYGELYYEIYLGDNKGLAHAAWWGNYFAWRNELTADLQLGATWLRLGYRGLCSSTKVNHIVTRSLTNSFVIGVSGEWMSLNPRKALPTRARIISACY